MSHYNAGHMGVYLAVLSTVFDVCSGPMQRNLLFCELCWLNTVVVHCGGTCLR